MEFDHVIEEGVDFWEDWAATHRTALHPLASPFRHAAQSGVVVVVDGWTPGVGTQQRTT
jgi:hypothetical protein